MAQTIVLYKTPNDTAAFNKEYAATHISLAKKVPGLRKYEISRGPVMTPFGPSSYHLVATLHFDSMQAMQSALARQPAHTRCPSASLDILLFDNHEV
jgi:uncharacterized protein (TIGR02118 family)